MYTSMKITFLLLAISAAALACFNHKSCETCTKSTMNVLFLKVKCQWCPLSQTCHVKGSIHNDCKPRDGYLLTSPFQCAAVADPPMKYDSKLAAELARWSSLAYVEPEIYNKVSIQSAVSEQFDGEYQVVEYITVDCPWIFDNDTCTAVIARSELTNRIIVSIKGTKYPNDLIGPAKLFFVDRTPFDPIGGLVLRYYNQTHKALYPCVKSLVEDLLALQPFAEVMVTGHSIGGAQAQLIGANLVKDGLVSKAKLHVYTFGSPRVGTKEFAYNYDRLMGNSWRVTREDDPIPLLVPRTQPLINLPNSGYHTRREVFYPGPNIMTSKSNYQICRSNDDRSSCLSGRRICTEPNGCYKKEYSRYFMENLPQYMKDKMSKEESPHSSVRGVCKVYSL